MYEEASRKEIEVEQKLELKQQLENSKQSKTIVTRIKTRASNIKVLSPFQHEINV